MNTTKHRSQLPVIEGAKAPKIQTCMKFLWLKALVVIFCTGHTLLADTFGLFSYTDNGTDITITGYSTTAVGAVTIPDTIIGKPVTTIGWTGGGQGAFASNAGLTSIHIPASVTNIVYGIARGGEPPF